MNDGEKIRRGISGMSEDFYVYSTLTKHDIDQILTNERIHTNLKEEIKQQERYLELAKTHSLSWIIIETIKEKVKMLKLIQDVKK